MQFIDDLKRLKNIIFLSKIPNEKKYTVYITYILMTNM